MTHTLSRIIARLARRLLRPLAALPWLLAAGIVLAQAPAAPQEFGPQALEQMRLLQLEKAQLLPHQRKIDSQLRRMLDALKPSPRYPGLSAIAHPVPQADGALLLDIDTSTAGDVRAAVQAVQAAGGSVIYPSAEYKTLRARVPVAAIEGLAQLPGVRFVTQAREAITNKVNTSQGDVTHRAAAARGFFGYDGTGTKVCVLSDGVNSLASIQASGDLPPVVDVLPGQAGAGDEGTAMLEIVHDLAPGAALGFATAFISEASFAANIVALKNAGCNIIVDDVGYFDESPFQEGPVVNAVNTVTAAGVLYFSSAANSGNKDHNQSGTWEGDFNGNGAIAGLPAGTTAHNFGDGGKSIQMIANSGNPITLHWNDPFGTSGNDYDLYVMNSTLTMIVGSSTNVQNGNDIPYEAIGGPFSTGQRIVVVQHTGAANRAINVATNRGRLDATLATAGNVRGHNGSNTTVSVAATPVALAACGGFTNGPFPSPFNAGNAGECFTSDGPRRMYFDFAGNFLPGAPVGNYTFAGGVVYQKPDLTAADGVMTATPGFNPFYGTSAAAPHAAAIAALVKQAFPAMTNTQIRNAMKTNAIDIEAAGWDRVTGTGITMAYETLQALGAVPAAILGLGTVTPAQVAGNGNAFIDPGEDWKFDIVLNNTGAVTAYGVVATLVSNTPGIVVTSGPVSYPNIGAAGSAANPGATPFRFSVTSAACGAAASFTLTVNYGGGAGPPLTATIPIVTGGLGPTSTFTYSGGVVPIPDGLGTPGPGPTAVANLNVAGLSGNVGKVVFKFLGSACSTTIGSPTVGLDHSWVGDLLIQLVAPDGTTTDTLVNHLGGFSNDGINFCQTTLDDASAGAVIDGVSVLLNPFTGSFKPSAPLATFAGKNGNGTWQLQATDFFMTETGSIRAWSLDIQPLACAAPSNPTTMTATKTVSGSFVPGGTVDYTVTINNTGTGTQVDNPGDEFTDPLPAQLTFQSASASSGTISLAGSTVKWNGSIPGGGNVKIVISAKVNAGTTGLTVTNQGTVHFDPSHSGTNSISLLTDDPGVVGATNPTQFVVGAATGLSRTFVSSTGNNANPCTLISPCRDFQAALAATVPDGEIAVLDAAGYGFVSINKPVTIISPPGVYAGISIAAGHGIDVNPGAGRVVLRGLTLTGAGGDIGVSLMSGDALYIENCVISGFTAAGVLALPSAQSTLFIRDSTLRDNGTGAALGAATGASGPLRASIERSRFENNTTGIAFSGATSLGTISDTTVVGGTFGLNVNPTTAGAATMVTVRKSTFTKAATSGVRVGGAAGTTATASLVQSQVAESGIGLETLTGGTAYVSGSAIVRNTTGVTTVSGTAISLGDNQFTRNTTNGTFSATVPRQ